MSLERDISRYVRYDLLGLGGPAPFVLHPPEQATAGRPKIRLGGLFVTRPVKVRLSGAWHIKPMKLRANGSFSQV